MSAARWLPYVVAAFILGIALKSFWEISWLFPLSISFTFLVTALWSQITRKEPFKFLWPLAFVFLFLALGIFRVDSTIKSPDQLSSLRDNEKIVSLNGVIKGEPDIREDNVKYTILSKPYNERILVTAPLGLGFGPGDTVSIEGRLQTPAEFLEFNYKDYLLKEKIRTVSYYPELELIEENKWSFLGSILEIKEGLRESSRKILPFPQSEILSAMTLGDSQLLPEDVKEDFNKIGIRHIVAISGMHIAIIIGILAGVLSKTKLSRFTLLIVSVFLIFYIILIGYPPSAVRAGVMGSVLLLAQNVKRKYFAQRALLLAAFVMLLWNPLLLKLDVGFQLSFLAVLGIILSAPFFENLLKKILKVDWLAQIIAITLAAQIFTLPILIYNFGIFSVISPLANVLVVPLLPFIIAGGFMAMLGGLISTWLGMFLAYPIFLILKYITFLSEFLSSLPWSFRVITRFNIFWVVMYYLVLILVAFWFKRKRASTNKSNVEL